MKFLISVLLLLGVLYVGVQIYSKYETIKRQEASSEGNRAREGAPTANGPLPGLPESLEPALQAAQKQGATGLANFLNLYRPRIRDPRLASIELDYVVLVSLHDPAEARRIFKAVQQRTPRTSPVYTRIKNLEKNFQ